MNSMKMKASIVVLGVFLVASVASAQANMDHGSMHHGTGNTKEMDHSTMGHSMESHAGKAMGVGVIHRVSKLNRMVNLTHEPIPSLNWPEMTMDLPVAKSVDLGSLKAGDKVKFNLELRDDKKYVITDIMQ